MHKERGTEPGQARTERLRARPGSGLSTAALEDWPLAACRKQLAENNGQGWVYFIRL